MRMRSAASAGLVAAVGLAGLASVAAAGQASTPRPASPGRAVQQPVTPRPTSAATPGAKAAPFRTPWGDPDLLGVWSYGTSTPLERPSAMADKAFFTPEEAASREAELDPNRPNQVRPAGPDDPGTYNQLWLEPGGVALHMRTSLIVDPPDGRLPPLTDDARRRIAARVEYLRLHPADSWLDRPGNERCLIYHGAPPIGTGYANAYQIFQAPGQIAILDEVVHDVRMIPLDGRPRPQIPRWSGESRGHWEGATLVVETTNYSERAELLPGSPLRFPASRQTRAIERFTRTSQDRIDYTFTIEDATVYTRPWTAERPMPRLPGYVIYEYACHEGNHAMEGILAGARAEEAAAAKAADAPRK